MNRCLAHLLLLVSLVVPVSGQLKDTYVIVKQNDFEGIESYSVMTENELRLLDAELRKEGFMATRARIMATKAWEDDETKKDRFPAGMISPRRATKVGRTYRERDEAESSLSEFEIRLVEKEREAAELEKRREKNRDQIRQNAMRTAGGGNTRNSSSGANAATRARQNERNKERDQENAMREAEREIERKALLSDAAALYAAQIEILKNPPAKEEATPQNPAPPQ